MTQLVGMSVNVTVVTVSFDIKMCIDHSVFGHVLEPEMRCVWRGGCSFFHF